MAVKQSGKAEIVGTANDIFDLLLVLSSPRSAAAAIALAHLRLIASAGAQSEENVRAMMGEVTEHVVANWRLRAARNARMGPERWHYRSPIKKTAP